MRAKTAACVVVVSLLTTSFCPGGEIRGRITDLFGNPRASTNVYYRVRGRDPDNGEFYQIQDQRRFTTSAADDQRPGSFQAPIPDDKYRANTKEIIVDFSSPNLASVQLTSLLGPALQQVELIIPEKLAFETRTLELALAAYFGRRSAFHVVENEATAFYHTREGKPYLAVLNFEDEDEKFYYFRQNDGMGQRWALARTPAYECCWRHRRLMPRYCGFPIWVSGSDKRWRVYDRAKRVIPANGYASKQGTIATGTRIRAKGNLFPPENFEPVEPGPEQPSGELLPPQSRGDRLSPNFYVADDPASRRGDLLQLAFIDPVRRELGIESRGMARRGESL